MGDWSMAVIIIWGFCFLFGNASFFIDLKGNSAAPLFVVAGIISDVALIGFILYSRSENRKKAPDVGVLRESVFNNTLKEQTVKIEEQEAKIARYQFEIDENNKFNNLIKDAKKYYNALNLLIDVGTDSGSILRNAFLQTQQGVNKETLEENTSIRSTPFETVNPFSVGESFYIGTYKQNGYEPSVLEWIIVKTENGKMLLVSKYAHEYKSYDNTNNNSTWESCSLRKWLNSSFYSEAFNSKEKKCILTRQNNDSPRGLEEQNPNQNNYQSSVMDKVFILNESEYADLSPTDQYITQTKHCLRSRPNSMIMARSCWIRDYKYNSKIAFSVDSHGKTIEYPVNYQYVVVRPAIYISIDDYLVDKQTTESKPEEERKRVSKPEEERKELSAHQKCVNKSKKRKRQSILLSVLAIICIMMFLGIRAISNLPSEKAYSEAFSQFDQGNYKDAAISLESIWPYKDSQSFYYAVRAFRYYNDGDLEEARRELNLWKKSRAAEKKHYLSQAYVEKIEELKQQVDAELLEQQKAKAAAEEEAKRAQQAKDLEMKEHLKDQMPYVGMAERYISYTCLGDYAYYKDLKKSSPYRVYIFKNSKGQETYSVTCQNSVVTKVWDKLNSH